jgi:hypothetical protein
MLVQDIIKLSMGECGVTRIGESPTIDELETARQILNVMLGAWSADQCMIRAILQESFALVAQQAAYTIGPSASYDFNTAKPMSIVGAFVRDTSSVDYPLDIVQYDMWDSYTDKQYTYATPISLYYNPGLTQQSSPYGTINLYYAPDSNNSYTLFIDSFKYLTEFATYAETVTFEAVYYEALISGLSVRLFRHYHGPSVPIPADMADKSTTSKSRIMTLNNRPPTARIDVPGKALGLYNIFTGMQNNQ